MSRHRLWCRNLQVIRDLPSSGSVLPRVRARRLATPVAPRLDAWREVPLVQPWKPWFALNDLTQVGPFPPLPSQPPDAYRLSLGKITDTLRLDYEEFFDRKPDFSIYDPAVVLQLRKPWSEPKQMAGCKQTYVGIVKAMRTFCKKFLHEGSVECQVCDGRPYGCDLRVHWTCKGHVNWIGETSVMISAISLYTLKHCDDVDQDELAWRVHSHIIDVTEIRPCSLRNQLMNSEAAEPSLMAFGVDG